jgi:hypothetical protein
MCSEGIVCNYTFIVQQGTTFLGQLVEFCALYAVFLNEYCLICVQFFYLRLKKLEGVGISHIRPTQIETSGHVEKFKITSKATKDALGQLKKCSLPCN